MREGARIFVHTVSASQARQKLGLRTVHQTAVEKAVSIVQLHPVYYAGSERRRGVKRPYHYFNMLDDRVARRVIVHNPNGLPRTERDFY